MYSRQQLTQLVEQYISSLSLPSQPEMLYQPIEYSMQEGGKRLRPVVVLLCCNAFCERVEQALPAAAAIEVFHNFTLLHDDIMDKAPVRRGKPTVHVKWDTNTAILSGDAMVIYAYSLLSRIDNELIPSVLKQFNKMSIEVCEGQQYDINFESETEVSIEQYIEMIRLKTSVLLAGAAKIGAYLGGATSAQSDVMYDFAISLGLAFQIQDDLLDTYGNNQALGKSIGGDIMEGKKTFLTITALNRASQEVRASLNGLLEDKGMDKSMKIDKVTAIYDSLSVSEHARHAIEQHLVSATESLNGLGLEPSRTEPLKELVNSLLNRNK